MNLCKPDRGWAKSHLLINLFENLNLCVVCLWIEELNLLQWQVSICGSSGWGWTTCSSQNMHLITRSFKRRFSLWFFAADTLIHPDNKLFVNIFSVWVLPWTILFRFSFLWKKQRIYCMFKWDELAEHLNSWWYSWVFQVWTLELHLLHIYPACPTI